MVAARKRALVSSIKSLDLKSLSVYTLRALRNYYRLI